MRPDDLQRYVQAPMAGARTSDWLDSLPIYVDITLCELVGGLEQHGPKCMSSQLDPVELSNCASTGFQLLQGPESNFRDFVRAKSQAYFDKRSYNGGRSLLGRLYDKLAHNTRDPNFDPVRKIMLDEVLDALPLGPGDDFFGPVTERKLHSVQTAHKTYGLHPKRLMKSLVNAGLVSEDQAQNTPGRILLDASLMESFVSRSIASVSSVEAMEQLGLGRRSLRSLSASGLFSVVGARRI